MRASTAVAILCLAAGAAPSVALPFPAMKSGGAGANLNKPRTLSPYLHLPSTPPSTPPLLPRDPSGLPMGSPLRPQSEQSSLQSHPSSHSGLPTVSPLRPQSELSSFQYLRHSSPKSGLPKPMGPPLRAYHSAPSSQSSSLHPTSPSDHYSSSLSSSSPNPSLYMTPPPFPPMSPGQHTTSPPFPPMTPGQYTPPRPGLPLTPYSPASRLPSNPTTAPGPGPPITPHQSIPPTRPSPIRVVPPPLSPVSLTYDSDHESYRNPNRNPKNLGRELLDRRIKLAARAYVRELLTASMDDLD